MFSRMNLDKNHGIIDSYCYLYGMLKALRAHKDCNRKLHSVVTIDFFFLRSHSLAPVTFYAASVQSVHNNFYLRIKSTFHVEHVH